MRLKIIIKGAKRGTVDLYANNIFNTKYATGGGTSRNHNIPLGFVEDALHTAGVPCKSTGSTNALLIIRKPTSQVPSD